MRQYELSCNRELRRGVEAYGKYRRGTEDRKRTAEEMETPRRIPIDPVDGARGRRERGSSLGTDDDWARGGEQPEGGTQPASGTVGGTHACVASDRVNESSTGLDELARFQDGIRQCETNAHSARREPRTPGIMVGHLAGAAAARGEGNSTNEANFDDDVIISQNKEAVEVVANSGVDSGLDTRRTKPIWQGVGRGKRRVGIGFGGVGRLGLCRRCRDRTRAKSNWGFGPGNQRQLTWPGPGHEDFALGTRGQLTRLRPGHDDDGCAGSDCLLEGVRGTAAVTIT